jgi:hypothetical protein
MTAIDMGTAHDRTVKPLLAVAVEEAVKLAFADSCLACEMDKVIAAEGVDAWMDRADDVRTDWSNNPSMIPDEYVAGMDRAAFAQNLCCRLLGTGGWQIGDLYTGNATPQEVFDASIGRAHEDPTAAVRMALLDGGVESADITTDVVRDQAGDRAGWAERMTTIPSRFRKKPVEVEAWPIRSFVQGERGERGLAFIPEPVQDAVEAHRIAWDTTTDRLLIDTRTGTLRAELADWLVRDANGEFSVCAPDVFEATFAPADAMPKLAQSVVLDLVKRTFLVDGQPFPWHIEAGPVVHYDAASEWGTVRIELQVNGSIEVKGERGSARLDASVAVAPEASA